MKKQILVIHGGNAFETKKEYLDFLQNVEARLEKMRRQGWKDKLGKVLGDGYDVLLPLMPNASDARYAEWKIWFEKIVPLLDEEIILVGHSLGGIFLAKYLSENNFPKKIRGTFLVAPPYNTESDHPLVDFLIMNNLAGLSEQGGKIFIYQSRDDELVPFSNCESYQRDLPGAKLRIFEDRGHFKQDEFPEIVADIISLD
jgi:uncharacterized protein